MMRNPLAQMVDLALKLFALGLFISILFNWLSPAALAQARRRLNQFYDFFLDPLRRYVRPVKFFPSAPAGLDLAPVILLLLVWWLVHPFLMWVLD